MSCRNVSDCPRNVRVEQADQSNLRANQTLKCSADGHPAPMYKWIDNINGKINYSRTHTLQHGEYDLTCVAYNNVSCPWDDKICTQKDSAAFGKKGDTNFLSELFEFETNPDAACDSNTTITGHAFGKVTCFFS